MAVIYRCLNCEHTAAYDGKGQCARCGTPVEPVEGEIETRDVEQLRREGAGMAPFRPAGAWVERPHGIIIVDDPVKETTPEQREALAQFARERLGLLQQADNEPAVTLESIDLE